MMNNTLLIEMEKKMKKKMEGFWGNSLCIYEVSGKKQ